LEYDGRAAASADIAARCPRQFVMSSNAEKCWMRFSGNRGSKSLN